MNNDPVSVLVVDDNPDDAGIIRRLLAQDSAHTFDVSTARDTKECLRRLRIDGADLVLLDYQLPGEDGLSFLKRASREMTLPPVIMLTGQGDERLAVESIRSGAYDYLPKHRLSAASLGGAAEQALVRFQEQEARSQFDEQITVALAGAVGDRDAVSGGHLQRLSRYAVLLGRDLSLDDRRLMLLRYGGLLHDIGKLAVPLDIVLKPGPLTDEEWEAMRAHALVGERICGCLTFSSDIARIVRHHHERWDGTGYPDGLAGANIPTLARVIAVVDAYDAMSSDRPYRRALSAGEVTRRLVAGAGSQWDPHLIRLFLRIIEREALRPTQRRAA